MKMYATLEIQTYGYFLKKNVFVPSSLRVLIKEIPGVLLKVFIFSISCFLVSMSGNTINLMSDYEGETFPASRMRISPYSRIPLLDHNPLEPEVMHLSDDSDSKRVFRESLEEITS